MYPRWLSPFLLLTLISASQVRSLATPFDLFRRQTPSPGGNDNANNANANNDVHPPGNTFDPILDQINGDEDIFHPPVPDEPVDAGIVNIEPILLLATGVASDDHTNSRKRDPTNQYPVDINLVSGVMWSIQQRLMIATTVDKGRQDTFLTEALQWQAEQLKAPNKDGQLELKVSNADYAIGIFWTQTHVSPINNKFPTYYEQLNSLGSLIKAIRNSIQKHPEATTTWKGFFTKRGAAYPFADWAMVPSFGDDVRPDSRRRRKKRSASPASDSLLSLPGPPLLAPRSPSAALTKRVPPPTPMTKNLGSGYKTTLVSLSIQVSTGMLAALAQELYMQIERDSRADNTLIYPGASAVPTSFGIPSTYTGASDPRYAPMIQIASRAGQALSQGFMLAFVKWMHDKAVRLQWHLHAGFTPAFGGILTQDTANGVVLVGAWSWGVPLKTFLDMAGEQLFAFMACEAGITIPRALKPATCFNRIRDEL